MAFGKVLRAFCVPCAEPDSAKRSRAPAAPAKPRRSDRPRQEKFVILELPESPGENIRRRNRIVAAFEKRKAQAALADSEAPAGSLGPSRSLATAGPISRENSSALAGSVRPTRASAPAGCLSQARTTALARASAPAGSSAAVRNLGRAPASAPPGCVALTLAPALADLSAAARPFGAAGPVDLAGRGRRGRGSAPAVGPRGSAAHALREGIPPPPPPEGRAKGPCPRPATAAPAARRRSVGARISSARKNRVAAAQGATYLETHF